MLKVMPFKFIKSYIPDNNNWSLNDSIFGFAKVRITISPNCKRILLPQRINDKIVYKSGTFEGIYFTEELRLYLKIPYYKFI